MGNKFIIFTKTKKKNDWFLMYLLWVLGVLWVLWVWFPDEVRRPSWHDVLRLFLLCNKHKELRFLLKDFLSPKIYYFALYFSNVIKLAKLTLESTLFFKKNISKTKRYIKILSR